MERNKYKYTELHRVCKRSDLQQVSKVLQKSAEDVNTRDISISTPLHYASKTHCVEIVSLLLKHKADVKAKDVDRNTALHLACKSGSLEIVLKLLQNHAVVNVLNKDGLSPLHMACKGQNLQIVLALIERQALVNAVTKQGHSPLHIACEGKNLQIVLTLIERQALINSVTKEGNTPLHCACKLGRLEIVVTLIQNGAEVNIEDRNGLTALHFACQRQSTEIVTCLLKHKAKVNAIDRNRLTPLHTACWRKNSEIVSLLLQNEVDVNFKDRDGWTPLHMASHKQSKEIVLQLLRYQAAVNTKTKYGETPLHLACKGDNLDVVVELIEEGKAELDIKDNDKDRPITNSGKCPALMLLLKGIKAPKGCYKKDTENMCCAWKTISNKVHPILDWSFLRKRDELTETDVEEMINELGPDFRCRALILFNDSLQTMPNLRKFRQFQDLKVLLVNCAKLITLKGLPDDLQIMGCPAKLKVMSRDCFYGLATFHAIYNGINLDNMVQPPKEVIKKGREFVYLYYKLVNSRNRVSVLGCSMAGKTSLVRSLLHNEPRLTNDFEMTKEICISEWRINDFLVINLLDHDSHCFTELVTPYFLTSTSMTLIVHNPREPFDHTKQILLRILHQNPNVQDIHFALTHIDKLDRHQEAKLIEQFQNNIKDTLKEEVLNVNCILNGKVAESLGNYEKTRDTCESLLDSVKYFPVSSYDFTGIKEFADYLVLHYEKQKISVSKEHVDVYSKIKNHQHGVVALTNINCKFSPKRGKDDLKSVLRYLAESGLIIWLDDHYLLKDFICDRNFVISLLKCLFHQDVRSVLKYDKGNHKRKSFDKVEFDDLVLKYEKGLIHHKILHFLLTQHFMYSFTLRDEAILIEILKLFTFFKAIPSESGEMENEIYFVSWLVKNNQPPECLDVNKPMMFTPDSFTLTAQCTFFYDVPLNLVEMYCVKVQKYILDNHYRGIRNAWVDGLRVKVGCIDIFTFKNKAKQCIYLCIRSKFSELSESWHLFKNLFEILEDLLKPWKDVYMSLHVICPHCIVKEICDPHKFRPQEVFEASRLYSMTCEKDHGSEIPSALCHFIQQQPSAENNIEKHTQLVSDFLQKHVASGANGVNSPPPSPYETQMLEVINETRRVHREHILLQSNDASALEVKFTQPVLVKYQADLEKNLNPNMELLVKMVSIDAMTIDDKKPIDEDKTRPGKIKRILYLLKDCDNPRLENFISSLAGCQALGPNVSLAKCLQKEYLQVTEPQ